MHLYRQSDARAAIPAKIDRSHTVRLETPTQITAVSAIRTRRSAMRTICRLRPAMLVGAVQNATALVAILDLPMLAVSLVCSCNPCLTKPSRSQYFINFSRRLPGPHLFLWLWSRVQLVQLLPGRQTCRQQSLAMRIQATQAEWRLPTWSRRHLRVPLRYWCFHSGRTGWKQSACSACCLLSVCAQIDFSVRLFDRDIHRVLTGSAEDLYATALEPAHPHLPSKAGSAL